MRLYEAKANAKAKFFFDLYEQHNQFSQMISESNVAFNFASIQFKPTLILISN